MQVVAMRKGFYGGVLRRVGDIFDMKPGKDDKLPRWVEAVKNPERAKAKALEAKTNEDKKHAAAAHAASGGKAAKAKVDAAAAELIG